MLKYLYLNFGFLLFLVFLRTANNKTFPFSLSFKKYSKIINYSVLGLFFLVLSVIQADELKIATMIVILQLILELTVFRSGLLGNLKILRNALISFLIWVIVLRYVWWIDEVLILRILFFIFLTPILYFVFLNNKAVPNRHLQPFQSLIYFIFLFLCSVNFPESFGNSAYHHWSAFIATGRAMQDGAWLLWDAPSQYGFLNQLTLYLFAKFSDVWSAFYLLNSLLIFGYSWCFFLIAKQLFSPICAFITTFSVCYLLVGWPVEMLGPIYFPSVSGMRFFPSFLILSFVWCSRYKSSRSFLLWGNLLWLLGFFWSVESAIYSTVVWVPIHIVVLINWKTIFNENKELNFNWIYKFLPIICIVISSFSLCVYYVSRMGNLPDPIAFVEHAFAFGKGYGFILPNFFGPLLPFLLLLIIGILEGFRFPHDGVRAPQVKYFGSIMLFWATSSYYFLSRSHDNNLLNLVPQAIFLICGIFQICTQETKKLLYCYLSVFTCTGLSICFPLDYFDNFLKFNNRLKQAWAVESNSELEEILNNLSKEEGVGLVVVDSLFWDNLPNLGQNSSSLESKMFIPGSVVTLNPLDPSRIHKYIFRFNSQLLLENKSRTVHFIINKNLSNEFNFKGFVDRFANSLKVKEVADSRQLNDDFKEWSVRTFLFNAQ